MPRAYDGRTVGYIALGDGLRVVDTGRDVGVSPPDVGVFWFRALCLGRACTTVGPSATLRSVVRNARINTGRNVGVSPPDVGAFWFRALCLAARVRR